MQHFMQVLRSALMFVLVFLIPSLVLSNEPPLVEYYEDYDLEDCYGHRLTDVARGKIRHTLLEEIKKHEEAIERIIIRDRICAKDDKGQPLGAIILAYSTVMHTTSWHEEHRGSKNIYRLLAGEEFGIFQYNPTLTRLIKTIEVFPSQRWLDYFASIQLTKENDLIIGTAGSYDDGERKQRISLSWN